MKELKHFTPYLYHVIAELDNIASRLTLFLKLNTHRITDDIDTILRGSIPTLKLTANTLEVLASMLE